MRVQPPIQSDPESKDHSPSRSRVTHPPHHRRTSVLTDYPSSSKTRVRKTLGLSSPNARRFFGCTRCWEPVVVFGAMHLSALVKSCGERATDLARQFDFSTF